MKAPKKTAKRQPYERYATAPRARFVQIIHGRRGSSEDLFALTADGEIWGCYLMNPEGHVRVWHRIELPEEITE